MTRYERVIKVQLYKVITFSLCFDQRVCCLSISSCPRLRLLYIHVSVSTSKKGWRPIIYIVLSLNYIYIYRSRFFHVEASRLFIEPRAHDCYLSIDDKRNPIREARLTRIEKVGKKDWKINVTLFKKKKKNIYSFHPASLLTRSLTRVTNRRKASFQKFSAFREAFDRSNICIRVVWYVIHALVLDDHEKTSNEYLFASGVCLPYWKV